MQVVSNIVEAKKSKATVKFWIADVAGLENAIASTGKSRTAIASKGGLSTETLKKALDGARISEAKANGICNGLSAYDAKPAAHKETLFSPE